MCLGSHIIKYDQMLGSDVTHDVRMEERGQLQVYPSQSFCILFETIPIWILAMRPDICHIIYVPNCDSFVNLNTILDNYKIDKTLYHLVIDFVGAHHFRFSEPNDDVLYLVSGSISFLNDISLLIRQKKKLRSTAQCSSETSCTTRELSLNAKMCMTYYNRIMHATTMVRIKWRNG